MKKKEYRCKYCDIIMNKFDFENYNGYCGKCREVIDWKNILGNIKDFKK